MALQRDSGPLPNRWLRCPRKSGCLIADRFLAFKTPLSSDFKDKMPLDCMFPPEMLFSFCKATQIKLGLWIDLTNTKRFYDRKIVESFGCQYVKLQCRGHGETPSLEQTRSFIELINEFQMEHPLDAIGVHCTHGFNRTGFLIVAYMVERMDFSVAAALALFAAARPPGIYKQDYIDELFRRYDFVEDAVTAPELPEWCFDFDDSNHASGSATKRKLEMADQEAEEDDEEDKSGGVNGERKAKKRRKERIIKDAKFMDGVSGVVLVTDADIVTPLQQKVQNMCGWKSNGFPGSQPVSMDINNIRLLFQSPYRVSWKADGTRYMMLINKEDEVYFFDRNFSCFQVNHLTFPRRDNVKEHLKDTLLDGEMVLDNDRGVIKPRYLVYDIVYFDGNNVGKEKFPQRLEIIKNNIVGARNKAIMTGFLKKELESFGVHDKPFWKIEKTASLLSDKFAKTLLHEPDGLIYQPRDDPYIAGQCDRVLKWKPHKLNSVDFLLKISVETGIGILERKIGLLYVGGHNTEFAKIKYTKALANFNNKIIECSVNSKGEWEFMRERTDKSLPNSYTTAKSVIESIRNPVTDQYLIHAIKTEGYKEDEMLKMPPPPAPLTNDSRHMPPPRQQQQQHAQLQQEHYFEQQQFEQHRHDRQRQQEQQQQQFAYTYEEQEQDQESAEEDHDSEQDEHEVHNESQHQQIMPPQLQLSPQDSHDDDEGEEELYEDHEQQEEANQSFDESD